MLNDSQPAEPQSWNLYCYVRNNPLRFVDPTGTILRDADGNIIFDETEENVTKQYYTQNLTNGGRIVITGQVDVGTIYADDGTAIEAQRSRGELTATVTDANGNITYQGSVDGISVNGESFQGYNNLADCHGVTFVEGQYWINNDQVSALMTGDGYDVGRPVSSPQVDDVGIYSRNGTVSPGNDGVVHSVKVASVDPDSGAVSAVRSKGGITRDTFSTPGPGPGSAWPQSNTQLQYFRKDPNLTILRQTLGSGVVSIR